MEHQGAMDHQDTILLDTSHLLDITLLQDMVHQDTILRQTMVHQGTGPRVLATVVVAIGPLVQGTVVVPDTGHQDSEVDLTLEEARLGDIQVGPLKDRCLDLQ